MGRDVQGWHPSFIHDRRLTFELDEHGSDMLEVDTP